VVGDKPAAPQLFFKFAELGVDFNATLLEDTEVLVVVVEGTAFSVNAADGVGFFLGADLFGRPGPLDDGPFFGGIAAAKDARSFGGGRTAMDPGDGGTANQTLWYCFSAYDKGRPSGGGGGMEIAAGFFIPAEFSTLRIFGLRSRSSLKSPGSERFSCLGSRTARLFAEIEEFVAHVDAVAREGGNGEAALLFRFDVVDDFMSDARRNNFFLLEAPPRGEALPLLS
jgi:hypothetical protein